MPDFLQSLDTSILTFASSYQTPILTPFFQFLSGIGTWGLVWIIITVALFIFEEVEDKRIFGALFLSLIFTFVGIEWGIKNLFQRVRPDPDFFKYVLFGGVYKTYSFPSTHATIAFAAAFILSVKHPKFQFFYYFLAFCIGLSRIYLGHHYFTDVVGGAIFGFAIGWISLRIVHIIRR